MRIIFEASDRAFCITDENMPGLTKAERFSACVVYLLQVADGVIPRFDQTLAQIVVGACDTQSMEGRDLWLGETLAIAKMRDGAKEVLDGWVEHDLDHNIEPDLDEEV